jgi:hypothetical protein
MSSVSSPGVSSRLTSDGEPIVTRDRSATIADDSYEPDLGDSSSSSSSDEEQSVDGSVETEETLEDVSLMTREAAIAKYKTSQEKLREAKQTIVSLIDQITDYQTVMEQVGVLRCMLPCVRLAPHEAAGGAVRRSVTDRRPFVGESDTRAAGCAERTRIRRGEEAADARNRGGRENSTEAECGNDVRVWRAVRSRVDRLAQEESVDVDG